MRGAAPRCASAVTGVLLAALVLAPPAAAGTLPRVSTVTPGEYTVLGSRQVGDLTITTPTDPDRLAGPLSGTGQERVTITARSDRSGTFVGSITRTCTYHGRSGTAVLGFAVRVEPGGQTASGAWYIRAASGPLAGLRGGGTLAAQIGVGADLLGHLAQP